MLLREILLETLRTADTDRLGLFRSLFLGERSFESGRFYRLGFVHVWNATGIHLWVLEAALYAAWGRIYRAGGFPFRFREEFHAVFFAGAAVALWSLQDFRFGFLRPLALVLFRLGLRVTGFRASWASPLVWALCVDAFISAAISRDSLSGAIHYGLSILGGYLAVRANGEGGEGGGRDGGHEGSAAGSDGRACARAERESGLRLHLRLSLYSWLWTVPLGIAFHGEVAPWTAVLSLVTIPILSLFVYPVGLALLVGAGVFPGAAPFLEPALAWLCALANAALGRAGDFVESAGGVVSISAPVWAGALLAAAVLFLGWPIGRRRKEPVT